MRMRLSTGITLQEYLDEIERIIDKNLYRGFADWRQCGRLCMDLCGFLEAAAEALTKEKRYSDLFAIACTAYIRWSGTDKDDSNGETQDFCYTVKSVWQIVYDSHNKFTTHSDMFDWFEEVLRERQLIDYMEDGIYEFLLMNFKETEELNRKKRMLEQFMFSGTDDKKYSMLVLEGYYLQVLRDIKAPIEDIRKWVAGCDSYTVGEMLADIELEYGNVDEAVRLYEHRIADRPDSYWSNPCREALIGIYEKQGDRDKYMAELKKYLYANRGNQSIFRKYKAEFSKTEWEMEWQRIMDEMPEGHLGNVAWFAEEDRYDLIMEYAEPCEEMIIDTYPKLLDLYPDRCLQVLVNHASAAVTRANKRSSYWHIANTFRTMSKLEGGLMVARQLAMKFVEMYPR
ncbi:MAG: hypothetical protein HUJ98_12515, partial [Bacteroidaceae bacterium]|nr:hypothetical protein [Bacteroidaceae bacterium]